jgi:hypothetical protein
VIQNYRAVADRLSPQEYEEVASEAFGRMSREERREYKRMLREQGGAQFDDDDDDPATLARSTAQYRQQSAGDDPLASLFGVAVGWAERLEVARAACSVVVAAPAGECWATRSPKPLLVGSRPWR